MRYIRLFEKFNYPSDDFRNRKYKYNFIDFYGMDIERVKALFFEALKDKNSELGYIQEFLISGLIDINEKDDDLGFTPLHIAVYTNSLSIVRALILECEDLNLESKVDNNGRTALHLASLINSIEIVKLLIESGANVNSVDSLGSTPLHLAVSKNYLELSEILVSNKADLNIKDTDGLTPLHIASYNNKIPIAEFLIKSGSVVNEKDYTDKTPLDWARDQKMRELLISHGGIQ